MANLVETLMQELRVSGAATLGANEQRPSEYGALDLFNKQSTGPSSILSPALRAQLDNSFGNVVKATVIDYENPTISNVRTCEVQVGGATTKKVPFTFFTLAFGFPMVPSEFVNQDVSYEEIFNSQLRARILKAQALLDTKCVDFLNLSKNQYFPAEMLSYYAQVAGALQVGPQTIDGQKAWPGFYNNLGSILAQQDFAAVPDILTNPRGMASVRQSLSQGEFNGTNRAWEVDLVGSFFQSPRVLNNTGVAATEYAVLPGSVAITGRLDPDCRAGRVIGGRDNPSKLWTKAPLPGLGEYGLYYRADCADESARLVAQRLTGLTRTYVESFEWSRDYCIFGAYNSDPANRYAPVTKAELLQA